MTSKRFRMTITLQEDMHSGTGMGGSVIDACQFRDREGKPGIRRTHLKGLLREAAEELVERHPETRAELRKKVDQLFGTAGKSASHKLLFHSLRLENGDKSVLWSSASRQPFSRVTREDFLRTVEYVGAGSVFRGELELRDSTLEDLLRRCFQHVDRIGSRRQRGNGLVTITLEPVEEQNARPVNRPDETRKRLRLRLHNLDPLVLPATGQPGNIIPTECYIRGGQLLGAFVAWQIRFQKDDAWLHDASVSFSNAYPLPYQFILDATRFEACEVVPIPLNLGIQQQPSPHPDSDWPHWAKFGHPWRAFNKNDIDLMESHDDDEVNEKPADPNSPKKGKRKKPHDWEFLFREGGNGWIRYKPGIGLYMRNDAGSFRRRQREAEKESSNENEKKSDDANLFSMEGILEDTRFQADLDFATVEDALRFQDDFEPLLRGESWLILGRGGCPVEVEDCQWIAQPPVPSNGADSADSLILFLESDLLARSETLGYPDRLSPDMIGRLLERKEEADRENHALRVEKDFTRTQLVHGFNAASGLPRVPVQVFRRGSIMRLTGADVPALREALRKKCALGERTREGFGRFRLDFAPLNDRSLTVEEKTTEEPPLNIRLSQSETIYETAKHMAGKLPKGNQGPSISQWRDALDHIRRCRTCDEIQEYTKGLKTTEKLGGLKWKEVPWDELVQAIETQLQPPLFATETDQSDTEKAAWVQEYFTYLIRRHVLSLKNSLKKERKPS